MLRKDILKALKHDASTASPEEIARFSLLAQEWWNPHGAFKVVHSFNAARLSLLIEVLLRHFSRDPAAPRPLDGLHVLDVGCGGGPGDSLFWRDLIHMWTPPLARRFCRNA